MAEGQTGHLVLKGINKQTRSWAVLKKSRGLTTISEFQILSTSGLAAAINQDEDFLAGL